MPATRQIEKLLALTRDYVAYLLPINGRTPSMRK
jgi:hypothetical protein